MLVLVLLPSLQNTIWDESKQKQPSVGNGDRVLTDEEYREAGPLFGIIVRGYHFWFTYIPSSSVKILLLKMQHYKSPRAFLASLNLSVSPENLASPRCRPELSILCKEKPSFAL
jgi:hypothetical protein